MERTFVTFLLVLGICRASLLLEDTVDVDLKYRLPPGVIPTAYKLHLTPDLETFTFEGEVEITLVALITNNILTLNLKDLTVHDINFMDLNTTKTLWNYYITDPKHQILSITTKPHFEKDHHYSLKIKYNGIFNDNMRGLYVSRVVRKGGDIAYIITTNFKPTGARLVFPCWDEPAYKAKFNITLTHAMTLQAISNMDVLKKEEEDGMMITSFKETPPMSTYLLAFVISDNQFKEDKVGNFTYRVWAEESMIEGTDYALKMGRKLLEQLNSYMNISYQTFMPDKIDQVLVKDLHPADAIENWGLMIYRYLEVMHIAIRMQRVLLFIDLSWWVRSWTPLNSNFYFREDTLLYDDVFSVTRRKIDILAIIAQEITHQWFGNLVSPKWWKYLWLSEGLSTYFQYFLAREVNAILNSLLI
ncbi:leucyl-cystinyl aminopeptidase-like [Ceratina calcarata]|uniref:Leucyl-cystinyl aminopeptidase-like n=1 Tax=Ceratina calcarata TaxID=156304 RepID=A0AAJ7WD66_9HYME|nr:leucyl-cystinyl aminopeptidase-like [Ceratina calcarata]